MTYPVPTQATGHVVSAAEWNQLATNSNDADTRLDTVEARTTDTSGTVGIGNQRLSDRLGSGITTASTATAQLATITTNTSTNTSAIATINTNLGTWSGGTAISRIAALESTTTNTSGNVGIGNQRLSDRLGATITTASTAAAQIGTINTNLGTWSGGTAISRIVALESAPSSSLGYKNSAVYTGDITGIGTSDSVRDNITATLVSGRRYKITYSYSYYADSGSGQNIHINMRYQSGGTLTTSGTVVVEIHPNCGASFFTSSGCMIGTFVAPSAGTFAMGVTVRASASTVALAGTRTLLVEDVGV